MRFRHKFSVLIHFFKLEKRIARKISSPTQFLVYKVSKENNGLHDVWPSQTKCSNFWCAGLVLLSVSTFFLRNKFRNLLFLPLSTKESFLNHLRNSFILVKCFLKSDDTRLTLWLFYVMWMDKGNKLDNVVWNAFFM